MKRLITLTVLVLSLSLAFAAPVLAAAPSNDTYANRTAISVPFSDTVDTSEATTDADDAEANAGCAPATDASVWYELTAPADMGVIVDVSDSSYSAGVVVVTGSPGSFEQVECGAEGVLFSAVEGETYAIVAFDDQLDESGNGGTLVIEVSEAPPPPEVDVTVDSVGSFDSRTGSATISGTVTCSGEDIDFAGIEIQLRQRVGRFIVNGFGFGEVACDGDTHSWSVEVSGDNGSFKGGQATALVSAFACSFDCGSDFEEATVKLRR
jgi:hypothetical protein